MVCLLGMNRSLPLGESGGADREFPPAASVCLRLRGEEPRGDDAETPGTDRFRGRLGEESLRLRFGDVTVFMFGKKKFV